MSHLEGRDEVPFAESRTATIAELFWKVCYFEGLVNNYFFTASRTYHQPRASCPLPFHQ
jgi:hypothetical protein